LVDLAVEEHFKEKKDMKECLLNVEKEVEDWL